jgi:hypothetical protein
VEAALEPVFKQLGEKPSPAQILNLKVCDLAMGSAAFLVEACRQLGDALVNAWHAHHEVPVIPLDEDEALYAQRLVSQRCLYGLDKNQMAADLAKLSLWLATLAKDHPFTFLDHSLRHGDALVGLTRKQIAAFNWAPAAQQSFFEEKVRSVIDRVSEYRQRILNARDNTPYAQLAQELGAADDLLSLPRMIGDAAIAAFFSAEKPKPRDDARKRFSALIEADLKKQHMIPLGSEVDLAVKELRTGKKPTPPFHWELEFPEVFTTDKLGNVTGGFDVIVGNPPFAGKNTLASGHVFGYLDWLQLVHDKSHGNSDVVAHFFRSAFSLLRRNGSFGLIATKTIRQGDTRYTGLRWICSNGGTIYLARRRLRWPGDASVIVSVVHLIKGEAEGPFLLDNRPVPTITAYLFHTGGNEDPAKLSTNESGSFNGVYVLGMGFTFDDTDRKGIASPLSEMSHLIAKDQRNQERIFPYIGGEEVNDDPEHRHHRYIINFADWPLCKSDLEKTWMKASDKQKKAWLQAGIVPSDYPGPVAADFPDLLAILEEKVKPERAKINDKNGRRLWWRYMRVRQELQDALRNLPRVLVTNCGAAPHLAVTFLKTGIVYANTLALFPYDCYSAFAFLQSRPHRSGPGFLAQALRTA